MAASLGFADRLPPTAFPTLNNREKKTPPQTGGVNAHCGTNGPASAARPADFASVSQRIDAPDRETLAGLTHARTRFGRLRRITRAKTLIVGAARFPYPRTHRTSRHCGEKRKTGRAGNENEVRQFKHLLTFRLLDGKRAQSFVKPGNDAK